ncbi:MAG TPA: aldo/keto reductase, partial [Acidimicrobiales bacterium]|nr:aldo/keto reductase [Acidimicrobiales bacterium]
GFVAYSPLGRGLLTGAYRSPADLPAGDTRIHRFPRFGEEHFDRNLALVDAVTELAAGKGCTPGQVAIAWVLAQGPDVVPIPGTKRLRYLEENVAAAEVALDADDLAWLDANVGPPSGDRYADMGTVNR